MGKSIIKLAGISILLLGLLSAEASFATQYSPENWKVKSFHSDIFINENGKVDITETIVADFSNEAHRGIERSIPYTYDNGREIKIKYISAVDESGESWYVETFKENGTLYIQMTTQDDSQMHGKATFKLNYTAGNAILIFDEKTAQEKDTFPHDEFPWNINGTDWVVPAEKVSATIHLPKEISSKDLQIDCFTGLFGSEEKNCKGKIFDEKTIEFTNTKTFKAYENMTIYLAMPPDTIKVPLLKKILSFLYKYSGFILPIITLLLMYGIWSKFGRDDTVSKKTVIPHYTPPRGLKPSEVGTLIDENVDPQDIISTIIDYAIKGYIEITELEKEDYELKLKKTYETSRDYETKILEGIFAKNVQGESTKISELENKFYSKMPDISKSVMKQLIKNGYFPSDPSEPRNLFSFLGMTIVCIGIFGPFTFSATIGTIISGVTVIIFSRYMGRKTKKGGETYYELQGLYEYIETAEKDRIEFQEKNNILFEKLLPYAMAFGLAKKWTEAFAELIKTPPDWYKPGRGLNNFTFYNFANSLGKMGTKMGNNMTSRPGGKGGSWSGGSGFGGGGFSGGGFGGGGGRGL